MTIRSARESSRIDVSFANAAGVVADVLRSGSPARSDSIDQFGRRRKAARDQHAWKIEREGEPQRLHPGRRVQVFEVPDFAFAEHEHAARAQVLLKSRERQAGFLRVRIGDYAIDAVRAGEQFERQTERVGPAPEQATHGDAWSWGHLPFSTGPCAGWTSES